MAKPYHFSPFTKVFASFLILFFSFLGSALAVGNDVDNRGASAMAETEQYYMKHAVKALRFGLKERFVSVLNEANSAGAFPEWLLEFNENLLSNAAPNALLFTSGRQDTLGLWYLQNIRGLRQDVTVMPMALLGQNWYVLQLLEKEEIHPAGIPLKRSRMEILKGNQLTWDGCPICVQGDAQPLNLDYTALRCGLFTGQSMGAHFQILNGNQWRRAVHYSPMLKKTFLDALRPHLYRRGVLYTLGSEVCKNDENWEIEKTYHWLRDEAQFDAIEISHGAEADSLAFYYAGVQNYIAESLSASGREEEAQWINAQMTRMLNQRLYFPGVQ